MKDLFYLVIAALVIFFLIGLPIWASWLLWREVNGPLMFLVVPVWGYLVLSMASHLGEDSKAVKKR